jgi:predicted amidohydrolase YtcJ
MKYGIIILMAMAAFACDQKREADLLIYGGTIYTLDSSDSKGEALVIKEGRILEVGETDKLRSSYSFQSEMNIDGAFVYPGFMDAHCHFPAFAQSLLYADLTASTSQEDMLELLYSWYIGQEKKDFVSERINGWGWDQNNWPGKQMPTKEGLDSLFPDIPVVLRRVDGHAALVNQAAIDAYQICCPGEIEGGQIVVEGNELTGLLIDNAADLIPEWTPPQELYIQLLKEAEQQLFAHGLTGIHDAGLFADDWQLLRSLLEKGELKMPMSCMAADDSLNFAILERDGPIEEDRFWLRSVKFYSDGALGSRGALLLDPYHDVHDRFGLAVRSQSYLKEHYAKIYELGLQVCTHAIGDSANRMVLRLYSELLEGPNDRRWRVEHAQVVHPEDRQYFSEYSILPSVQPTHATSDSDWAEERLGKERMNRAYAYKSLLNQWLVLPLGTDFPIEDIDPLKTFYAAVARRDFAGNPEGGFLPNEALSRKEALKGMTLDAAYAQFRETETGSLEKGKWADIVVLDKDILYCEEAAIPSTGVLKTLIRGEKVFPNIEHP